MRVLVTGGAGFVGSHVADVLAARGHEVRLVDSLLDKAHGGGGTAPWANEHDFVQGDVRDAELMTKLVRDADVVCHQAAMVGHGLDPSDGPAYTAHNDYATAVLLAAMYSAGRDRLVLASSMVVYGEGSYACARHGSVRPGPRKQRDLTEGRYEPRCPECGHPVEWRLVGEAAPLDPRSTYAATKVAQEHLASVWARQTGGQVWALRYHNVYGPRMPRDTPYAGVASLFRSALARGEAPTVLEDGLQCRDFVHVRDVALANALAVERTAARGTLTPVNVCSGEPHTVGELAASLARACDGPAPRIVGGARPADVRHVVADPRRAEALLGFRAEVSFVDGVTAFARDPQRASAVPR